MMRKYLEECRGYAMRTTINLAEDALIAARNIAQRERLSLGEAVSELTRRGTAAGSQGLEQQRAAALRGRYALLAARDEVVKPQRVHELMEREGI